MLYIQKEKEPEVVINWKRKFKNINKRRPGYEDIKGEPEKRILKGALIAEQKALCCYCCNRITESNSHIEHFVPQNARADLSLEYTNLHASCQGEKGDMRHCGHAKSSSYDEALLISPLDVDCEKRFSYTVSGKMEPSDPQDEGAKYTIATLALNDERLKRAREEAMWAAEVFLVKDDFEKKRLIEKYSGEVNGKKVPFCDAILFQLRKG